MSTLYVTTSGTHVRCAGGQVVVGEGQEELVRVPLDLLELVVLQGRIHLTSGCQDALLRRGIPVAFLSGGGRFLGRMEPESRLVAATQRAQLRFVEDPERVLSFARVLVTGKLENCRVTLENWFGENETEARSGLRQQACAASRAANLESLRGHEGAGGAAYFQAIRRNLDPAWGFERRAAHPPEGPANSLLSFGYTLLYNLFVGAIRAVGLNPYLGAFHADREGHAALASDLMEEWRPILADRVVMALIRNAIIQPGSFSPGTIDGAMRLQAEGRKLFLSHWERKLSQEILLPSAGKHYPYRTAILQQVLHAARHFREPDASPYVPMGLR